MSTIESKAKVIDVNTDEVLFECSVKESERAYEYAAQLEEMGLDVKVHCPSVTETLCDSLGIINDAREDYEQSVVAETEDHDGSCCATPIDYSGLASTTDKIQ